MRQKRHLWLICGIGIVLSLALITTWTPDAAALDLQAVGQIGGPTKGVALQGNYAYVGAGLHLAVIDTSDPLALREVGTTAPFPSFVEGVAVSGTLAYVAAGEAGLRVVNVSDPTHPFEVGAWDSPGYAEGVAVVGSTACLADGPYGLSVLDVSNPALPRQVGSAYDTNYAFGVAVVGSFAYIAGAGAGLLVADLSDPAHPVQKGTLDTPGYAFGVAAAGNTVYVADGWEGLRVVNVADPLHPVQVGSLKTSGWAFGVAVSGSLAYLADSFNGLRVIDVSTPANPVEVGGYGIAGGHAGGVAVAGGIAYVADRNWGLQAIDVSQPAQPAPLGMRSALTDAWDVTVSGNYAYVATLYHGLRIVDISDPAHPVQVGSYDADGQIDGVKVVGSYAYLAVGGGKPGAGLQVVDVSNPSRPGRTGFIEISPALGLSDVRFGIPRDLEVVGNVAYVTNEQGLLLISVSDPTRPAVLGFIMLDSWGPATVGLAVSGTRAFVVKQNRGLAIVDVSNSSTPTLMGTYNLTDTALDADVAGNLAFVVNGSDGFLRIVDVSDPSHPATLGSCGGFANARGVTASGALVYVGDGVDGVKVVDVSDPLNPVLVGTYDTPGYARTVAVAGQYIYVADLAGGLLILKSANTRSAAALPQKNVDRSRIPPANSGSLMPQMINRSDTMTLAIHSNRLERPSSDQEPVVPTRGVQSAGILSGKSAAAGMCIVGSTADSGPGTFRECLNHAMNGDTITFDPSVFPPGNSAWIQLNSGLPPLSQGNVTIDASNAGVIINGNSLPAGTDGIVITSDGNTVKGLQLMLFQGSGLVIRSGAKRNTIGGNRLQGSGPMGEGNLVSGNKWRGVFLSGSGTDDNVIIGNYIGTDTNGKSMMANGDACIAVGDGAQNNRIGGPTAGERNLVSGCGGAQAVHIYGTGTMNNVLIGNYIGMDATGMAFLPCQSGPCRQGAVEIRQGASRNRIGGLGPGERNIISASGREGVSISDYGSMNNMIIGNYIGPDASGTAPLGSAGAGIWIQFGASNNLIQQNVISGNDLAGIFLYSVGCNYNVVVGNLIGTDASGTMAMGNHWYGVLIGGGASFNRIGGTAAGERNVISGNDDWNISLGGEGKAEGNLVIGNYIGTDVSGTKAVSGGIRSNGGGVSISAPAGQTFIGGTTDGEKNVISGNTGDGVRVLFSGPIFILGNYIGTDALGIGALSNQGNGIRTGGAENALIQNNIIAYNSMGISVWGVGGTIRRNSIHDNVDKGISTAVQGPIIATFTSTSISGTACPGCLVDVFSDADGEGQVYEGSAIATASGAFTFNKTSGLRGPNITATATDSSGNSSGFSTPQNINSCSFSITPPTKTFAANGGTGSVSVTTSSMNCNWAATTNSPWIAISSGSDGTGDEAVSYSISANTSTNQRTGTITIAGEMFTIIQGQFPIGDINHDGIVDLMDAALAMQIASGVTPTQPIYQDAAVNGDGNIGLSEFIYILQVMAGVR